MKSRDKKQKTGDTLMETLLKFSRNIDRMPPQLLAQTMNETIRILARRGIKIRDWDDREKVVHGFKCFGDQVFLLAPRETPGTEGDADGQNGKPGGKRTPDIEKISTAVLQNQETAGNPAGQASDDAPRIQGRS